MSNAFAEKVSAQSYRVNVFADVAAFHTACDVPFSTTKQITDRKNLRSNLVNEEHSELREAMPTNYVQLLDASCDLIYVLTGTALEFGMLNEEARSELNKLLSMTAHGTYHMLPVSPSDKVVAKIEEINKRFVDFLAKDGPFTELDADDFEIILSEYMLEVGILVATFNFPFADAWAFVQGANMSKVNPETGKVIRRDDGKILKPENFVAPDAAIRQYLITRGMDV